MSCRFGNITTMEWWDNLYLNEGIAQFVLLLLGADNLPS